MKKIALSVLIITALIVTLKCSDNPVDNDETVEFVGIFSGIPNPCTTVPCLPGIVDAIKTEDRAYILTKNGRWFWGGGEPLTWNDYTPSRGDTIICKGKITEKVDLNNKQYFEIEIESLVQKK